MRKSERKNKRELPAAAKSAAEAAVGIFSTFSKAADAIGKGANGIYMKFPEMPILGRSGTAMLVFSAAIYVFFVMFVFFTLPPITISTSFSEGSLQPNAVLALQPSEKYAYASSLADGAEVLEYSVGRGQGCSGMAIDEVSGGKGTQTLCIMPDGSLLGETNRDKSGYGNKTIILFAPWMLSVSENFSWTVAVVSKGGGISVDWGWVAWRLADDNAY
ncbi:MAG: hypothetical protein NT051_05840 [Candidatus Micrarchaeota archaeon]|nr:hypothetical protein [Candidatus Micrarchaeota archaeon]